VVDLIGDVWVDFFEINYLNAINFKIIRGLYNY
jgi:hypothetical protein